VHDVQLEAIEVGHTGYIPTNATIARLVPNATVTTRAGWFIRPDTPILHIYGHHFDPDPAKFDVSLSSGARSGIDFDVVAITPNTVQLELKSGRSWLACSLGDSSCDQFCQSTSTMCILKVSTLSGFGGTLAFPQQEQPQIAIVLSSSFKMFASDWSSSQLLQLDPFSALNTAILNKSHFVPFGVSPAIVHPGGLALDSTQDQLFATSEASGSNHHTKLSCFDTSTSSTSLVFEGTLGPPALTEARSIALEHRRTCAVALSVMAVSADASQLRNGGGVEWKWKLRYDIARAMQVHPTQLAEPEITSVGNTASTEEQVDLNMILTTLHKIDETDALKSLQKSVRDAKSLLNTRGLVTHSSRAFSASFVASCVLKDESKALYVSSSTSGCVKKFKIADPSTKLTSTSLQWLPEPRTADHATVCNTGLSLCEASSLGMPVVNINKATVADMAVLYPMGVETIDAQKLVSFRTTYGPYQRIEDLKATKNGIQVFSLELYDAVERYISVHDPRRCSTDADCAAWDEQSCFSQVSELGETSHAYGIALPSTDPKHFYLSSEGSGMINQFSYVTGRLNSSTPVLGSHVTTLSAIASRTDLGECYSPTQVKPDFGGWLQSQLEIDGECSNLVNGVPVEKLTIGEDPDIAKHVPCFRPEHCTIVGTDLIASVEQAGGENAIFRSKHGSFAWSTLFEDDNKNGPFKDPKNIPLQGPVLSSFNGDGGPVLGTFLSDSARAPLTTIKALRPHPQMGILAMTSSLIIHYDIDTGRRLAVIADFGPDADLSDFVLS